MVPPCGVVRGDREHVTQVARLTAMSKQRRTRKASSQKPRRRPRPAGPAPDRAAAPTAAAVEAAVDRGLRPLAQAFDRWGESDIESVTFAQVAEPLTFAFRALATLTGHDEVTGWEPDRLRFLFDVIVPEVGLDPDAERMLAAALYQLTAFLGDTGRWTRSTQELSASMLLLQELAGIDGPDGDEMSEELAAAARTEVAPAVELAALRLLPVVRHLEALLTWLGPGRAVTATGALRLVDLPAAAALVGVRVRPPARSPGRPAGAADGPAQLALDVGPDSGTSDGGTSGTEDRGHDPGPDGTEGVVAASMWDVRELAAVWVTGVEAGLIEIGSTRARPTDRWDAWREADEVSRVELVRAAAARHLGAWLERVLTESLFGPVAVAPTVSAFFGALTGDRLRPGQVARVVADTSATTLLAPDPAVVDIALDLARSRLDQAVQAGVLRLDPDGSDGSYAVPDALVPTVARAMLRFVREDDHDTELVRAPDPDPVPRRRPRATRS